jgi:hypothetical protein
MCGYLATASFCLCVVPTGDTIAVVTYCGLTEYCPIGSSVTIIPEAELQPSMSLKGLNSGIPVIGDNSIKSLWNKYRNHMYIAGLKCSQPKSNRPK